MRQAGVLAAAGLVALATMPQRLVEDHARARRLAEGIAVLPGFGVDLAAVQTNMVYVEVEDADALVASCAAAGVHFNMVDGHVVRLVTHCDVDDAAIGRALDVLGNQVPAVGVQA